MPCNHFIDAENDVQVPGQHMLHQCHRPGFQRFGKERVIGVGEDARTLTPGFRPQHSVLVAEQAHKFGNADCRMSIVEVNGNLVSQIVNRTVFLQMVENNIL